MDSENSYDYNYEGSNFESSVTVSADIGEMSSTKEKICEESNDKDENIVYLGYQMKDIGTEYKHDGDNYGSTGEHLMSSKKEVIASSDAPNTQGCFQDTYLQSWDHVTNSQGSAKGGDLLHEQSSNSWGSWESVHDAPPLDVSSPPQNERQWPSDVEDDELLDESEDDFSDGFDSDDSRKSHDTRKKNKWLWPFFESLDKLSLEQATDQVRQWHCPACQDGPGAIDWFVGLHPLMAHAKTKGRVRIRLHRKFAELLEEELKIRGASILPPREAFGKWKGLCEAATDHDIVWPPMVVVMNTQLEKDECDKWKGMGNQELLEYFNTYAASKARHSYGPNGHRGMSVLIFEASSMGYLDAERLHKQFVSEGRDRCAWDEHPILFYSGGKRQLYGFLASKGDVLIFNRHSHGKSRLKFEMRSYQEMVVTPMRQMREDNQKLTWLENRIVKHERRSKVLEETFGAVSQKLRHTVEENRIVRLRTKLLQDENKEEMDSQEKFVKDQMDKIHTVTDETNAMFEKLLLEEQTIVNRDGVNFEAIIDCKKSIEEMKSITSSQFVCVEELQNEWEILLQAHEEKKIELKQKHLTEEIELETSLDTDLKKLIEKYTPPAIQISSIS